MQVAHLVLSIAFEHLNNLDALFFGAELLVPQLLHAKLDGILFDFMNSEHFFLVAFDALIHFGLQCLPKLIILLKSAQLFTIGIFGVQFVKHAVGAADVCLDQLGIDNLVLIVLLGVLLVVKVLLILAILFGLNS